MILPLIIAALAVTGVALAVRSAAPAAPAPPAEPVLPPAPTPPGTISVTHAEPAAPAARRPLSPRAAQVLQAVLRRRAAARAAPVVEAGPPRRVPVRRRPAPPAAAAPVPPQPPPVPDVVMRVLGDRDAREGDLAAALAAAQAGGHAPQVRILTARLANVRRIISVLERAQAASRRGGVADARRLLVEARRLSVADGRHAVIATIDAQLAALPRAQAPAVPLPPPAHPAAAEPPPPPPAAAASSDATTREVLAIRDELARGRDAADPQALVALIPRIERVLPTVRAEGRTELAAELARNLDALRQMRATLAAPAAEVPQVPTPEEMAAPSSPLAPPSDLSALALQVARNIARAPRRRYDGALLRRFQQAAGIVVDGRYGRQSRDALAAAGVPAAQLPGPRLYW